MPKSLVSLSSDIDPPCDFAYAYDKGQVPSVWKTHATSPRDDFSSSVSFSPDLVHHVIYGLSPMLAKANFWCNLSTHQLCA